MEIKKILVTGSEGYIGKVLVAELLRQHYSVTGFDTCYYGGTNKKNIRYRLIRGDVRRIDKLDLSSIDTVIHLAALSNDPTGELNPALTNDINFKSTITLAEKAKKQGVKRFIFSSSCSVYGIAKNGIVNENSRVSPLTAYAKSKIKSENGLRKLADKNFCVCLLRNSTVYGYSPNFRDDLVVNNLVSHALTTGTIRVMSDGTPWRPLIDVRDLSRIFIEFMKADRRKVNGKIFNIGFDENNYRVKDILNFIQDIQDGCRIIYTGEHGQDSRSYRVSFTKIKKILPKFKQQWQLKKSIKDLIINLKKSKFSRMKFQSGKHTRLKILNNLLSANKINNVLYWND